MTDPAPRTTPAQAVRPTWIQAAPPTAPVSVVHPSWGVNVEYAPVPVPDDIPEEPSGATAVARHAAPEDEEYDDDDAPAAHRLGPTAYVIVAAMICVTVCVALVSLFGDARGGAVLAGVATVIGAAMAYQFRERWR